MHELNIDLPDTPGVYIFKNTAEVAIYIGKAKNLKNRVTSYFRNPLEPKTRKMVEDAHSLSFIKVDSEFESLLLEAKLVRQNLPKYNIQLRDDKSPLYIGITKETYPRIILFRKKDLVNLKLTSYFGPFTQGYVTKKVLRHLRRIFPYADHLPTTKPCLYHQIGLCNPCPSDIEHETNLQVKKELRRKYLYNINQIKKILDGRLTQVKKSLYKEITLYSKQEKFETAQSIHEKIRGIDYLQTQTQDVSSYLENPNFLSDIRRKETKQLLSILKKFMDVKKLTRIECFDIAHLAGSFPTASMVTFIRGEADKTLYRHFKVKSGKTSDDISQMKGILQRRAKNFREWGIPDLIIVDGGKGQLSIAQEIIKNIPTIGLAKRFETIIIKEDNKYKEILLPQGPARNLMQRIRNEAHRFARRYHHKLITKSLK